ncbi:MAG: amidohydrolase family protein [Cyclobacteriaceae bacterium]|nr:amidohydrolase family protein [Cyclobacteriaceae bacterium]
MKRRDFLKQSALLSAASVTQFSFQSDSTCKTVLRGGKSFYNGQWQMLDVGIIATGKLKMGEVNSLSADEVVEVTGKIVSPGFIDILADNAANPERTYKIFEKYKVTDGVTTALQMHGGSAEIARYYAAFGRLPHRINYGVSTAVMRIRHATSSISERKKRVEQCLEEGALGVSHSIEYQPTPFAEVLEFAKLAKKYERPFFLHLRYSSREQELEGVEEAIRVARESGARVHINHLHSTGGTYHMAEALTKIRAARSQGQVITCCVYPYSYWATYLHSKRFDEGWKERYGLSYNDLQLVGTGERLTAQSFARYRELKKLVAVPEGTMPLADTIDLALKEDFCMIGSDGGIEYEPHGNSHPRGAGCFATAIRHALDIGMPLEKILEKITTMPRNLILPALKERGVLADGAWADLTVFDPLQIKARATVANPNQFSEGIHSVWVNGKLAADKGVLRAESGMGIRY